jgi:hypothetical protein
MTNQEFITSINNVENTSRHYEILDEITKKDPNRLFEIYNLIPKDQDYLMKKWQIRSVYEKIIKISSFELSLEEIEITNKIFENSFRQKDKNLIASILCFKHNSTLLINSLAKTNFDQLTQLVIHELISRRIDLSKSEYFEKIKKVNSEGEFKSLSLNISDLEKENDFPGYSSNGGSNGISFGFQSNEEYIPIKLSISQDLNFVTSENIKSALEHWGGSYLGYKGQLKKEIPIEQVIKSVPELKESTKFRIRELEPSKVYSLIFNASSNGSAYTTGYYGAHGRLRTWKTLHALVDNTDFESTIQTEKMVKEYSWFEFNTDYWFINEWLDLGIIGLNYKKMEFGIIAATDTD